MSDVTPESLAIDAIEKAEKVVDDLCQQRIRWTMSVPAEPDRDPDLVIGKALALAKAVLRSREGMLV